MLCRLPLHLPRWRDVSEGNKVKVYLCETKAAFIVSWKGLRQGEKSSQLEFGLGGEDIFKRLLFASGLHKQTSATFHISLKEES